MYCFYYCRDIIILHLLYCVKLLTLRYTPLPTAKMLSPNANSTNTAHAIPAANTMPPNSVRAISLQLLISHLPAVLVVGVFLMLA
jgi:hypothetical protein